MYTHPQRRTAKLTQKLRNEAGIWLRQLREKRGLSQRDQERRRLELEVPIPCECHEEVGCGEHQDRRDLRRSEKGLQAGLPI